MACRAREAEHRAGPHHLSRTRYSDGRVCIWATRRRLRDSDAVRTRRRKRRALALMTPRVLRAWPAPGGGRTEHRVGQCRDGLAQALAVTERNAYPHRGVYAAGCRLDTAETCGRDAGSSEGGGTPHSAAVQAAVR